jgi:hypothetical protein
VTFKKLAKDEWKKWKNDNLFSDEPEGDDFLTPVSNKGYKGEDGRRYAGESITDYNAKSKIMMRNSSSNRRFPLRRGNMGLLRLLIAVNAVGPSGISTYKLLKQLGSTNHAQAFIARAKREGLIGRNEGEPPGPGQFPPMFNIITEHGKDLLLSQFIK